MYVRYEVAKMGDSLLSDAALKDMQAKVGAEIDEVKRRARLEKRGKKPPSKAMEAVFRAYPGYWPLWVNGQEFQMEYFAQRLYDKTKKQAKKYKQVKRKTYRKYRKAYKSSRGSGAAVKPRSRKRARKS